MSKICADIITFFSIEKSRQATIRVLNLEGRSTSNVILRVPHWRQAMFLWLY